MLARIKNLFARRLDRATALNAVIQQFERSKGYVVNRSETGVLHSDESGYVIRVCYDHGCIPPGRAWFRISRSAADIQELSFEDVREYGEQYWDKRTWPKPIQFNRRCSSLT